MVATPEIDYDALLSASANCLRHDAIGDSAASLIIKLNEAIRALRAAAVESERKGRIEAYSVAMKECVVSAKRDGGSVGARNCMEIRDAIHTHVAQDLIAAMAAQEKAPVDRAGHLFETRYAIETNGDAQEKAHG